MKDRYFHDRNKLEKDIEKERKRIDKVKRICELLEDKLSVKDIMNITNTSESTIDNIRLKISNISISCNYNF